MEREALKLALEALEAMQMYAAAERKGLRICDEAITAIKEALGQTSPDVDYWIREATAARQAEMAMRRELEAQPAQEPVTLDEFLESEDFYELMQAYRHFPIDALVQFEAVKDALRTAHNVKERNFCPRCGKRTNDIHTCTPPQGAA